MTKIAQSLFSRHGSLWARQSVRSQQALTAQARVHIATRSASLRLEYEALESERALILSRVADDAEEGPGPLCMSAAALSDRDLAVWEHLRGSADFCSAVRIKEVRSMLCVAPSPEDPPALPDGKQPWCRDSPVMPNWVVTLAKDRDFCIGSASSFPIRTAARVF